MNDLETNITRLNTDDGPSTSVDFDPDRVFADPVAYLEELGLRSELIESSRLQEVPAAA